MPDPWRDTAEAMYAASVIPRRSVARIRRALADGRDTAPYLEDVEQGMAQILALMQEADAAIGRCEACHGTGRAA